MTIPRDIATPLNRINWRDGQPLASRDFRDRRRLDDHLRHLHVRYLHRTWGVVEGLGVNAIDNKTVHVSPGYALELTGREVLLPASVRLTVPSGIADGTTMYLVISIEQQGAGELEGAGCSRSVDLSVLCPGFTASVDIETGRLAWKNVTQVRVGLDILLARVLIFGGHFASKLDTAVVRYAATESYNRLWTDLTPQGSTGWRDTSNKLTSQLEARVDASDAGFIATPAYFAHLVFAPGAALPLTGHVREADPSGFTFVLRPAAADSTQSLTAKSAELAGVTIGWLAAEMPLLSAFAYTSPTGVLGIPKG